MRVWDDVVWARDVGDDAARWLADCACRLPGAPAGVAGVRLVRHLEGAAPPRLSSLAWTHGQAVPNAFSDGFPLLVVGRASVEALNARLIAQRLPPVDVRRMRPNLVLGGLQPHDEDRLPRLRLAGEGVELALTKPCARCSIPDVDPDTARTGHGVADTLMSYRQDPRLGGALTFGMNAFATSRLPPEGLGLYEGQGLCGNWGFD